MVKTLPSSAGAAGFIPCRELGFHMSPGKKKTKHKTEAIL